MPVIHECLDGHWIVKKKSRDQISTLQITREGIAFLKGLDLSPGESVSKRIVHSMWRRKLVYTDRGGPGYLRGHDTWSPPKNNDDDCGS